MQKFWNMAASMSNDEVLNMYVYGNIVTDSSWFWGSPDDVVTRDFLKDLSKYPNAKRINVYINSGGGEVFAAIAIAQQLKAHKAEVHTYVDSLAASAATLIAMAGDVRHMTTSGLFMIHLPSMSLQGNRLDFAKGQEVIQRVEDIIRLTYQQKCTLDDATLTNMLEKETWLDAYEAKEYGFIDIIEDPKKEDTVNQLVFDLQQDVFNMGGMQFKISAYADPEALQSKLEEIKNKKGGKETVDYNEFYNSLTEEQQTLVQDAIKNAAKESTAELSQKIVNLSTQNATLAKTVDTLQKEKDALQAENKKLLDANKNEDPDKAFLDSLPEEARKAVLSAREAAKAAQEALDAANEEKAYNAFKDSMKEYSSLPLQEEHLRNLYRIKKNNAQDYASLEELFKVANTAMEAGFGELGTTGASQNTGTTALEQIEDEINKLQKANASLSYNEAFNHVIKNNPQLYDRYRNEM